MRILHIVPSYKPAYIYGGPIESVSKLCEGLVMAGHQVDVFTTTANGKNELPVEAGKPVNVDGVNVIYFNRITKDHTHISPALWRHLYTSVKTYDIVHIQSWWNILVIVAACICHMRKVKVIISPRGMLSEYVFNSGNVRAKRIIHRIAGRYALSKSWFHATAEAEYNECLHIIPGWRGFVLPNILDLPQLPVLKNKNELFTLIFMSRVHPKKGIEILLQAISCLEFDIILKIAGTGEDDYISLLKELAVKLDITDRIVWMGWLNREKKFKELMQADLFTLVSLNENFANVVIESLHMGTPVLVSEEVALSSFVKEHDLGWVSSLEVKDVVIQLTKAQGGMVKREKINKDGRSIIEAYFSANKLTGNYLREYQKIIATKNNRNHKV
jgi:glycosyltransferase involved in cell wall biosynthesis